MKIGISLVLIIATVLWVTPSFAADVAAGKELYAKKCASCHGAAGEGKESIAKAMKVELKPLSSKEVQAKSDADLRKVVLEGTGKMKGVKDIDAKGAEDVVAFVRTLKK